MHSPRKPNDGRRLLDTAHTGEPRFEWSPERSEYLGSVSLKTDLRYSAQLPSDTIERKAIAWDRSSVPRGSWRRMAGEGIRSFRKCSLPGRIAGTGLDRSQRRTHLEGFPNILLVCQWAFHSGQRGVWIEGRQRLEHGSTANLVRN